MNINSVMAGIRNPGYSPSRAIAITAALKRAFIALFAFCNTSFPLARVLDGFDQRY